MKVKTITLQDSLTRVTKCAGMNKSLPLTNLICIDVKDGKMNLTTTDMTNYFTVSYPCDEDTFYAVVEVEQFSKLVSKITAEEITLELTDVCLKVVSGKSQYKLQLPLDEKGNTVVFPKPYANFDYTTASTKKVPLSSFDSIVDNNESALMTDNSGVCYTNYYAGESVYTTDRCVICNNKVSVTPVTALLTPEIVDVVDSFTGDDVTVYEKDGRIIFVNENCFAYTVSASGLSDYAIDTLSTFIGSSFVSMCKVPKSDIIQALDRLALFVGPYDSDVVGLSFSLNSIKLINKGNSAEEVIEYVEGDNLQPFACDIKLNCLYNQIKSNNTDTVEIWFNNDSAIKICDGDITKVIGIEN